MALIYLIHANESFLEYPSIFSTDINFHTNLKSDCLLRINNVVITVLKSMNYMYISANATRTIYININIIIEIDKILI